MEHGAMSGVDGISGERLKSFIQRIEKLEDEKRIIAEDIKDIYTEAKSAGFETKIMRQVIKLRRMDKDDRDEAENLLDLYLRALGE